jgi:hypothetical protein
MRKFLVHFKRSSLAVFSPEVLRHEQQRMADLMREQLLIDVKMNKQMDNIWMEFQMYREDELLEIIKTLPMCKNLYFEIHEIL